MAMNHPRPSRLLWQLPLWGGLLLASLPVAAAAAPSIRGLWLTQDKEAHIAIGPSRASPDTLCGRIVWIRDSLDASGRLRRDGKNPNPALRRRRVIGLTVVTRLVPDSPSDSTHWKAQIYDPKNGRTYAGRAELIGPNLLKLRGYVLFSLIGRTARWTRVSAGAH